MRNLSTKTAVKLGVAALAVLALLFWLVFPGSSTDDDGPTDKEDKDDVDLSERRGAIIDEVVFTQESDVGKVAGLIERGSHQTFTQGITNITAYHRLRDSERGAYETAYGSSVELALNPAEFDGDELNPFAVREIREAMNWLVNRRHVAEEIFGGLAVPKVLPINAAFPDYARLADTARQLELRYAYNPDRAREVVEKHMKELGAERRGGRWFYEGEPVTIRVLIRTEDARNQVGDYFANLMEDLGFRVRRQYRTAEEASRIWIAGDPKAGEWHVYTGSWVSTTINRDVSDSLSFYYTDRGRSEQLWQHYRPDEELDEIAQRLERRDFSSSEERRALMARGMDLALRESYRVWLVDQRSIIPRARDVAVAADLAGGISGSRLWPYTLRYEDKVGGRMVMATPSLLTEPWNPVDGSNWLFDTMITRSLSDPVVLPDPFTGLYWPQRIESAEVTVREGTPIERTHDWLTLEEEEKIEVPPDTWIGWDSVEGRFRTVAEKHPEGVEARSRIRITYEDGFLDRRWHDGAEMSLADLIMPWILNFARADEDSPLFDPSHVPRFAIFEQHYRGWRILQEDPLVIEVYSDQVFPDAETTVAQRAMTPGPWHTLALGMMAEEGGQLAFSSNKADSMGVDWMSYISGPSLNVLQRQMERAKDSGFIPFASVLRDRMKTDDEPEQRYQALSQWRQDRGHFYIGDGPFYLRSVHPVERTVVLRRNEDFPDPSDKWLDFSRPEIPELALDGPLMVATGDYADFRIHITHQGAPYPKDAIEDVQYMLFSGDGELLSRGSASHEDGGEWGVRLSEETVRQLGTGANSLEIAVTSSRVALPAFATHAFATVPEGSVMLQEDDDD